jgi:pyruvate carboxylase
MEAAQETHAICEGAICYTGNIVDPRRDKFPLEYYVRLAKEIERMGAHFLAIKDMAGLLRPYAARKLVKTLREEVGLPIHLHTHDSSGVNAASILNAADVGLHVADAALSSMSGSTSQPNLNSIVAALQHLPRDTKLDLDALNELSDYWEQVREFYAPFDTAPRTGSAEVYLHEMPGGQYTNLKEQAASMGLSHRWPEIARTYAEVNQLFGDIVKVTPSSKVVGDLTMFLVTRGIQPADILNLEPGATPFPESVVDMLSGGLGWPEGGWPKDLQRVVLGEERAAQAQRDCARGVIPGAVATPADFDRIREELAEKLKHEPTDDDVYSYLMYPQVFVDYARHLREFSDVSVLPTPAFFYGLKRGEEISVHIEEGKTLIIRLINVGEPDKDGRRTVTYELNGVTREACISDKKIAPQAKPRQKADLKDPLQVGAPIPGLVAAISVSVGHKVSKGDKLLMMEAMKMQTTITSPIDGVVESIHVQLGDTVESKDLLMRLRK